MARALLRTCSQEERNRRDSRVLGFVRTGNAGDGQPLVAGLDDGFHGIAEAGHDVQAQERLLGVGPKTAGRIGQAGAGGPVERPGAQLLQQLLQRGEVGDPVGLPVGDHDVGLLFQDRAHQVGNPLLGILVVPVGVDHDVRAQLQRPVHAVEEGARQTLPLGVDHEMPHPVLPGHLDGPVRRSVVDHQHLDAGKAGDPPGNRAQDRRQGLLFIQARDLYDQLHSFFLLRSLLRSPARG